MNFFKQERLNKPGEAIPKEVLEEVWDRCKN
jgi:hypothetical protein